MLCSVRNCSSEGNTRLRAGEIRVLGTKDKCCSTVAGAIDILGRHLALLLIQGHTPNPSRSTAPAHLPVPRKCHLLLKFRGKTTDHLHSFMSWKCVCVKDQVFGGKIIFQMYCSPQEY